MTTWTDGKSSTFCNTGNEKTNKTPKFHQFDNMYIWYTATKLNCPEMDVSITLCDIATKDKPRHGFKPCLTQKYDIIVTYSK